MRYLFLLLVFLAGSIYGNAQSNPLDKKMEKVYELIKNNKYAEADEYLDDLLKKHPDYGDGWDVLAQVRYQEYEDSKGLDGIFTNMNFTVKDEKGNEIKDDSLSKNLTQLMDAVSPAKTAYSRLINTLRKATLVCREAYNSSAFLRILEVDQEVDTNVSKKALGYYKEGEQEFAQKNYNKAAQHYKRAIETQPDFYKASLYLGDCFYATSNYMEAANSFKEAINKFPMMLEPRKYLIDAYIKLEMNDKVIEECVNSFCVYPDMGIYKRFEDALYLKHQFLDVKPVARKVFPNKFPEEDKFKRKDDDTDKMEPDNTWKHYAESYKTVSQYYDKKGLLTTPNSTTTSQYLEVYCWEEMLKKSNDPSLDYARKMQKAGYLDCYVLVTNFHYDIYDQYLKFIGSNKDRVKEYYKMITKYN